MIGSATFRNQATRETYELGFEIPEGETALSAAWDKGIRVACIMNNWNINDVIVVPGTAK